MLEIFSSLVSKFSLNAFEKFAQSRRCDINWRQLLLTSSRRHPSVVVTMYCCMALVVRCVMCIDVRWNHMGMMAINMCILSNMRVEFVMVTMSVSPVL